MGVERGTAVFDENEILGVCPPDAERELEKLGERHGDFAVEELPEYYLTPGLIDATSI